MKAMAVLVLALLPIASQADVILDDIPAKRPAPRPKKPPVVETETTATTTTASTTTVATTTTAAPAPVSPTTTTAAPVPAPVEASTVPEERRKTSFPFGALTAVGIALVVAITASRRKRQSQ